MNENETKTGAYLAIGAGVGTALGVAMGNIAVGVTLGISLGLLFGLVSTNRMKDQQKKDDNHESS